jgi:phage/plasmid primase-like uncharacterized protein
MSGAMEDFRQAMELASIPAPTQIIADGQIHRFSTNGNRSNLSGWYVLHNDGLAAGAFGDWRSGVTETWSGRQETSLTDHERKALRQRMESIKRQRQDEERSRHAEGASEAARIWEASMSAPNNHAYFVRKQVMAHGLRLYEGRLVVPMRDVTGQLHSLQFIDEDGGKRFLVGGRVKGCFYVIGTLGTSICIAEGFATGASIHQATGKPVAITFSAGNMLSVVHDLRSILPHARFLICGDNDLSDVGQQAARLAAEAVSGHVLLPVEEGWDWNDVAVHEGLDIVQHAVSSALATDSAVLDELFTFLGRFVAYPSIHAHIAHALWIVHTHLMDRWESTPRIAFLSPEPGSGKTRALEISETVVPRPVEAVNATPAYLFRKVSDPEGMPTILFDEIDTIFGPRAKEHEEIRGLLNAGHRRGAMAGRCVVKGKSIETEELPAFCPVALAGLGNLPDTILTRAVVVRMRRRAPNEKVEPYRRRIHAPEGYRLRDRLRAWTQAISATLNPYPDMPESLTDRPADVWEALLSVADAAGSSWPTRAREAAVALVADALGDKGSLGIKLLTDLRTVFGAHPTLPTADILAALTSMEEAPWGDLKGKPLDSRRLAQFLRPYGVSPKNIRFHNDIVKGYSAQDLFDPWQRYLPPPPKEEATSATDATPKCEFQLEAYSEEVNLDA